MLVDLGAWHLTHEVLSTVMADVMARPVVPLFADSAMPGATPNKLLSPKSATTALPLPGQFTATDLCKHNKQWWYVNLKM